MALDRALDPAAAWLHSLAAWDLQLAALVHAAVLGWPRPLLAAVAALSHLADRWVLGGVAALACLAVAWRGAPWHGLAAGALLSGQGLVVWALKSQWMRARPPGGALNADGVVADWVAADWVVVHGSSLPSGHTTAAVVDFGLLAWLALRHGPAHWQRHRRALCAAAALLALGVGLSRVLLGVHFATDVLAGWCLGGAWLAASLAVLRRLPPGRHGKRAA